MTNYLDIIRPYRRAKQGHPASADAPAAEPSRDGAASAVRSADASPKRLGEKWVLRVGDVLAEIGRAGSGPAKALGTYLERPNAERLGWLTKAVLRAQSMDTDCWERYSPVVEEAAATFDVAADERSEV